MLAALHERNSVAWVLSRPALRWLGARSYSIYLWHWPVFVLTQPQLSADLRSWSLLAARLGATLILAELSYRLVENILRGRSGWRIPSWDFGAGPYLQRPWARPAGVVGIGLIAIVAAGGLPLRIGLADDLAAIEQQVSSSADASASGADLAAAITDPTAVHTPGTDGAPDETTAPSSPASDVPDVPDAEGATPDPTHEVLATPDSTDNASDPVVATHPTDTPEPEATQDEVPSATATEPPSSTASASSGGTVDGVTAATPSATPSADVLGASVTIIGDSVALGALPSLQASLPGAVIDAEVGRQFWTAPEVISGLDAQGALGDIVVVSLGANGTFTSAQFEELMAALGNRTVLFVTVTVPRRWEGDVNAALFQQAQARGLGIIDWHAVSTGVAEYFGADGVHLTGEGRAVYASLIAQAVQQAIAARG
jgi:hypothetical protein